MMSTYLKDCAQERALKYLGITSYNNVWSQLGNIMYLFFFK